MYVGVTHFDSKYGKTLWKNFDVFYSLTIKNYLQQEKSGNTSII